MMSAGLRVSGVQFVSAGPEARASGLLGWIRCTLNDGVRLDGIALRRTAEGRHVLAFPERRDGAGRRHPYIRPLDDDARRDFEGQILDALGLDGGGRP